MRDHQTRLLEELRANCEATETRADGTVWGSVYLDNVRPAGMSPRAFAGRLSALERAGLYRSQGDDCFGLVLINKG